MASILEGWAEDKWGKQEYNKNGYCCILGRCRQLGDTAFEERVYTPSKGGYIPKIDEALKNRGFLSIVAFNDSPKTKWSDIVKFCEETGL